MAGETSPAAGTSPKDDKATSPTGEPQPPQQGPASPETIAAAGILPAQHWLDAAQGDGLENSDAESTLGSIAESTASLSASILEYREICGRTYHHEIGNASYWGSNDEKQNESMDINHHVQTLVIGGKLFCAPLETDNIRKVLDLGTGTGSWAIDFADEYPGVEVVGTDVSPIQSGWVPPNLKFEIEDFTRDWTFAPNSIDYIHARWLVGSIGDWEALFAEAFQALAPGGWLESHEGSPVVESDDGSVSETSAIGQWGKIFNSFGKSINRPFTVVPDGIQRKAMEAAGFVDIMESNHKTPSHGWPEDPELKEIGRFSHAAMDHDREGYVLYPATAMGWTPAEVSVYVAHLRKELRSPHVHPYYRQKVVWGRKPAK